MAHLRASEVRQLLHNKFVVIMGDSIQRAVYKDLVLLLQKDCLLSSRQLKAKGELSFERDVLLEGGRRGRMHNGTHYREVRQFRSGHHLVRFYFLTRAYSQYVEDVLEQLQAGEHTPDVVVMNSCLWDLCRYGRDRDRYRDFRRSYCGDLESLFGRLARALPESCLLVWNTTMPVAQTVSGGFLPPGHWPRCARLREDVLEANFYSAAEAGRHGFDVLDLHFHFRHAGQHRQRDGVHWDEWAHRHLSMLLLAHLAGAWGVDLPCRGPIRDGPAGRRPDPTGRRHPRDSRDDPTSSEPPPRLPCPRAPRQPYVPFPHSGPPFMPHHQDTYLPSDRSLQGQQSSSDTLARQIGYSNEANWVVGPDSHLGPIRTGSARHQGRGSAPYPPRSPSRPHRRQRRHTSRRT